VLVSGGAGFIDLHTVDNLLKHNYHVTMLEDLEPQVHEIRRKPLDHINKNATFIYGDVLNRELLKKTVQEVDTTVHLAAWSVLSIHAANKTLWKRTRSCLVKGIGHRLLDEVLEDLLGLCGT